MESIGTDATAIEILLVEDSLGHVRLTQEAFKDAKVHINLHVTSDGTKAIAFLRREGEHANVPRPDLILLDLDMPKKDGREVLEEIKAESDTKGHSCRYLANSASEPGYRAELSVLCHTNCYITKPVDLEGFLSVVRSIDSFWLSVVKLPRRESS